MGQMWLTCWQCAVLYRDGRASSQRHISGPPAKSTAEATGLCNWRMVMPSAGKASRCNETKSMRKTKSGHVRSFASLIKWVYPHLWTCTWKWSQQGSFVTHVMMTSTSLPVCYHNWWKVRSTFCLMKSYLKDSEPGLTCVFDSFISTQWLFYQPVAMLFK